MMVESALALEVETIEPARKLNQIAYDRFKEALFAKRIATGTTVSQADLVRITGIPVGPLREALQVLAAEEIIQILPRSGIRIVRPDISRVRCAFQLREILERPAIRKVAEAMDKPRLQAVRTEHEELLARSTGAETTPDLIETFRLLDEKFHYLVIDFIENPMLTRAYRWSYDIIRLVRGVEIGHLSAAGIARTMQEHLTVIDACLARDPEAAEAALEAHLGKAIQRSLGF